MRISDERILTTHVGSLPRPDDLLALLEARERGEPVDTEAMAARTTSAVRDIVRRQMDAGIDVVCDGEVSKVSYTFYVRHRLAGVGLAGERHEEVPSYATHGDLLDHPDLQERMSRAQGVTTWFTRAALPVCDGLLAYADTGPLEADLANLRAATAAARPVEAFVNAASPGVLTKFVPDLHYRDEDAYVEALANAMAVEYEAIHRAGFLLQIDAPDLGSARHDQYAHLTEIEFLRIANRNVEALNHATAAIPPEAMRLHICWGNYEGPHTHDVPLKTMLAVCFKARPQALLFEGANPRHAHEWEDLAGARISDDQILVPGVIDSTTNFVEHPRLVAQRIENYARIVGRNRVIAGTDCGFATFAGPNNAVVPSIVWAKLQALAEGAGIASERLWK